MGGGFSRHELAAAVSEAGGLGTIAVNGAAAIRHELAAARALTGKPLAVNLLLPFARRDWFAAAAEADVVVTFWGRPKRRTAGIWMHQCGSVGGGAGDTRGGRRRGDRAGSRGGRARARYDAGAGAAGAGAPALPAGYPLLLAGGIAERADVRERSRRAQWPRSPAPASSSPRRVGRTRSTGSGCSTPRRRSSPSSSAPAGRRRTGWSPTPQPSAGCAATARAAAQPPAQRVLAPGARYVPAGVRGRMARAQRPGSRLLSPLGPTDDGPADLLDAGPLYAGRRCRGSTR